jgi:hypothetical protein
LVILNDWQKFAVAKWDALFLHRRIAFGLIKSYAAESGSHLNTSETGSECCVLAGLEDYAADAAAGPVGMNEEGADLGGIVSRVQQGVFAGGELVAAVESPSFAPAARGDDFGAAAEAQDFRHEIGPIQDQLAVDAVYGLQRAFDLSGRIVLRLQAADRGFN